MLLSLFQLPHLTRGKLRREVAEGLGHQRAGEERQNVCKGSRSLYGCRDVPGWVPTVGGWGTTPPHHSSWDVCTCHWVGAERSREADLPRSSARSSEAEPQGRSSSCPAHRILDFSGADSGPLPWGIHAQKAAQPATLWAQMDGKGHQRHSVLLEELPTEEGRYHWAWRGPKGSCHSHSAAHLSRWTPLSDLREGLLAWWSPLGSQGGTQAGVGGCMHAGVKHWKTEQRSWWC